MTDFLTTREVAALLRLKERKVYDLVAEEALPFRRVTGKLLFPRDEIESWIAGTGVGAQKHRAQEPPLIMAGGHDPLLEWALRDSRSGIAALLDGALDGLARMQDRACLAAGLHIPSAKMEDWNVAEVAKRLGDQPVVLIEWAKRRRGLMFASKPKRVINKLANIGKLRFQSRQPEAGSELVLTELLAKEGLSRANLNCVSGIERTETDLAMAIADGRADVGLGVEAAARQFNLEFFPMVEERFDLVVWRKAYFDPPFQKFLRFCESEPFRARARALGGYDCESMGSVRYNGA